MFIYIYKELSYFKVGLHHGPWSRTIENGPFLWFDLMVWFLKKTTHKAFGPLTRCKPGVDQEEWLFKFDHSFVFSCSSSLPKKTFSLNFHYNIISLPWPLPIFLPERLFCLSHRKIHWTVSMDNVGLKRMYVFWGLQTPWSLWHSFPGVNWSGPETCSTTNHKFYRTLGQLHDPWYKQPLNNHNIT